MDEESLLIVVDLVETWGFPTISKIFYDEGIDFVSFKSMEKEDIKEIIKNNVNYGVSMRFWTQFKKWIEETGNDTGEEKLAEVPVCSKVSTKVPVHDIILNCAEGNMIYENYKKRPTKLLLPAEQKGICKLLTNHIMANRLSPGRAELRSIAEGIRAIFASESIEIYVKKCKGGILANMVNNRLEAARKAFQDYPRINSRKRKLEIVEPLPSTSSENAIPISADYNSLILLKDINTAWSVVEHHWKLTFEYRKNFIQLNKNPTLCDVYSEFPPLLHNNGFILVILLSLQ